MDNEMLRFVGINDINVGKRFREDLGDIQGLIESIQDKGILQPITIDPAMNLLAGGRRLQAAREAGLQQIPALVYQSVDEVTAREIELVENVFRKDFSWSERCKLIKELDTLCREQHVDWNSTKTAQLINRSKMDVSRTMRLANALEKVPELAEAKSQEEAMKALDKLEEKVAIAELRSRQDAQMEKGNKRFMERASSNYMQGDTFKGLEGLRTNGVIHLIECDPPYAVELDKKELRTGADTSREEYNEIPKKEYPDFIKDLCEELYRVAGKHCWLIFWHASVHSHLILSNLEQSGWVVDAVPAIWVKDHSAAPTGNPDVLFGRGFEPFYVARKGNPVMVKRGRSNVFSYPSPKNKIHPTERPLALITDILEHLTVPGQIVLSPFLGSGNTLLASYRLGLKAFGWDLSHDYRNKFLLRAEKELEPEEM